MKKLLSILLLSLLTFTMNGCANSNQASNPSFVNETDNQVFTAFKAHDLDENVVDETFFADKKITLINVWNVGCTPCIQELGILNQLNQEYADQNVAIVGLYNGFSAEISEDEKNEIKEIIKAEQAEYPQWMISQDLLDHPVFKNWEIFPGTFIVDETGQIIDRIDGSNDYEGWKEVIENALKKEHENA